MDVLIAFAVPVFLVLIVLEAWADHRDPARAGRGYEWRDTAASLSMGLGNVVIAAGTKAFAGLVFFAVWQFRLFDIPNVWWAWLILIPLEDLCYYTFHRASHEVRFFWAAHVNHHSSRHFNLSTALRQSWTTPFTAPLFYLPLAFLGFHPLMILTANAISLIYQFWIHTERVGRLPRWFEWALNTPSHHRVHHGANVEYLDRNYAGIFMFWDRLFGSFEPERAAVDYGLTRNIATFNPLRIAFHDWAAMLRAMRGAATWREALGYALQPPGWSPDGRTLTARQMQRRRGEQAGLSGGLTAG